MFQFNRASLAHCVRLLPEEKTGSISKYYSEGKIFCSTSVTVCWIFLHKVQQYSYYVGFYSI